MSLASRVHLLFKCTLAQIMFFLPIRNEKCAKATQAWVSFCVNSYSHILLSPWLVDKYSTYNNNVCCVVLLITDNWKDNKRKKQSFVPMVQFEILLSTYDQTLPIALTLISSFTPEKSSLILSAFAAGQTALFIGLRSPFTQVTVLFPVSVANWQVSW